MTGRGAAARGAAPNVFEAHPRLTLAVLLAVVLAALDLGAAALLHALKPAPPPSGLRVRDAVVHHALAPMFSGPETWGPWTATYHTSSLGLRDASARTLPLTADRRRLLLIGDSFTEGIGVDWPQTFAGRLSEALAPQGVEVLNAGAASYCPIIYERRIRQLLDAGLQLHEVAVFVDIGDVLDEVSYKHDEAGNVVGRETRRIQEERANAAWEGGVPALMPVQRFLEKHTIVGRALWTGLRGLRSRGNRRGAAWTLEQDAFDAYGREGLSLATRDMDALAQELASRGIALTLAVYPWPDQVLAGDRDSRQVRFWRAWCAAHGARFVDLFPAFVPDDPAARREVARRLFIPGDIHWNAEGHRVIAEEFLRRRAPGP